MSKERVGRNDLCPCGSGKKYKQCCGRSGLSKSSSVLAGRAEELSTTLRVIKDPEHYQGSPSPTPPLSLRKFSAKVLSVPQVQSSSGGNLEYSCFVRYSEEVRSMLPSWQMRCEDYRVSADEAVRLGTEKFELSPPPIAPISRDEKPSLPPEVLPHYTVDFRES